MYYSIIKKPQKTHTWKSAQILKKEVILVELARMEVSNLIIVEYLRSVLDTVTSILTIPGPLSSSWIERPVYFVLKVLHSPLHERSLPLYWWQYAWYLYLLEVPV